MKPQHIQTAILHPKPLKKSAAAVYNLLCTHFKNDSILTIKAVCNLYADTLIPKNEKLRVLVSDNNGKWIVKEVNSNRHFKQICLKSKTYQWIGISWLKYHIGNLVLNGYAVVTPTMNFKLPS